MVGGHALHHALEHPDVATVTSIGRRKLGIMNSRLSEVLHPDFADCSPLEVALRDQDAVIFCLGAYTGVVSDHDLRMITVNYPTEFARVFRKSSPHAALSFLSGSGADQTGKSRLAFARYKGEAERALLGAGFPQLYIFRAAYIYPVQPRKEPNLGYRLLRAMYPLLNRVVPSQVVRSDELAHAMVDITLPDAREGRGLVLENRDIRAFAKNPP